MSRVPNDRLVKITNMNPYPAGLVGEWSKIAHMAVSTDPYGWAFRDAALWVRVEPLVKRNGIPPHITVGGTRHLSSPRLLEQDHSLVTERWTILCGRHLRPF